MPLPLPGGLRGIPETAPGQGWQKPLTHPSVAFTSTTEYDRRRPFDHPLQVFELLSWGFFPFDT
jgi:hypothetical protein